MVCFIYEELEGFNTIFIDVAKSLQVRNWHHLKAKNSLLALIPADVHSVHSESRFKQGDSE